MIDHEEIRAFRASLLRWYGVHKRDLPWRRTSDAYAIWISEVMLQQTRVAAVIPFYQRFLQRFPTYKDLAAANEQELLAHWAGLGYYYRARNMQRAAQLMTGSGGFPKSYEAILALPGIGEYTAAAVASIAFGLPHSVVDGNVFRVLSRVCADKTNVASGGARKHFTSIAARFLETDDPGSFNQALMELGATVCLPRNPQCLVCPVSDVCRARAAGVQNELPVKTKSRTSVEETRTLLWIERPGEILVWQRPPTSRLMAGFWELPEAEQLPSAKRTVLLAEFRHGITFHDYKFQVAAAETEAPGVCKWLSWNEINKVPLSTVAKKARQAVARAGTARKAASSS